jgi:predicted transcriptional regulator
MKILWELDSGTVQAVLERMPGAPAYTTVQTMLNVLLEKGKVRRVLKDRAYRYRPVVSRADAVRHTMKDLIDRMFGGSAEALVMGLVETNQLSPERLRKLQQKINAKE